MAEREDEFEPFGQRGWVAGRGVPRSTPPPPAKFGTLTEGEARRDERHRLANLLDENTLTLVRYVKTPEAMLGLLILVLRLDAEGLSLEGVVGAASDG